MKVAYPIIIYEKESDEEYYVVYVPDFDKTTQGKTIIECIEMARDLIGITAIGLEESKEELPDPFTNNNKYAFDDDSFKIKFETLVDIDLSEYKRKLKNRSVKKTLTIPYYLNEQAEREGINFSRTLQEALEIKLNS